MRGEEPTGRCDRVLNLSPPGGSCESLEDGVWRFGLVPMPLAGTHSYEEGSRNPTCWTPGSLPTCFFPYAQPGLSTG